MLASALQSFSVALLVGNLILLVSARVEQQSALPSIEGESIAAAEDLASHIPNSVGKTLASRWAKKGAIYSVNGSTRLDALVGAIGFGFLLAFAKLPSSTRRRLEETYRPRWTSILGSEAKCNKWIGALKVVLQHATKESGYDVGLAKYWKTRSLPLRAFNQGLLEATNSELERSNSMESAVRFLRNALDAVFDVYQIGARTYLNLSDRPERAQQAMSYFAVVDHGEDQPSSSVLIPQ